MTSSINRTSIGVDRVHLQNGEAGRQVFHDGDVVHVVFKFGPVIIDVGDEYVDACHRLTERIIHLCGL